MTSDNEQSPMIEEKSIESFRKTGLLLIINQILHIFGWAIVVDTDSEGEGIYMYPARCKFRGFDNESTEAAYAQVTRYMENHISELVDDIEDKEELT